MGFSQMTRGIEMTTDTPPVVTTLDDRARDDVGRALLAAAHRVLADEGPFGLTVRRVAQAAGVSTMNVYSRFGGKDGLVEQLYVDGFARLGERIKEMPPTDDPLGDLRRCRQEYRRFALQNPTYYAVMFDSVVPGWQPSPAAEAVALAALGNLAAQVQRAIDAGQLQATDAVSVAATLWATSHGHVTLEMKMAHAPKFDWASIYEESMERLLTGLRTPPMATDYAHLTT